MIMITCTYDAVHGHTVPDGKVFEWVDETIELSKIAKTQVFVGSEVIIDAFRLRIAQGKLSPKDIVFYHEGGAFEINEYGVGKENMPPSFTCQLSCDILRTSIEKRRRDREQYIESCRTFPERDV